MSNLRPFRRHLNIQAYFPFLATTPCLAQQRRVAELTRSLANVLKFSSKLNTSNCTYLFQDLHSATARMMLFHLYSNYGSPLLRNQMLSVFNLDIIQIKSPKCMDIFMRMVDGNPAPVTTQTLYLCLRTLKNF